jgi:heat shock 70kDa protein 1/2/6/8
VLVGGNGLVWQGAQPELWTEACLRIRGGSRFQPFSNVSRCTVVLQVAGKLSEEDKSTITKAVDEAIEWLDANQQCEVDEYEHKLKELEALVNPIMQKMYAAGGAPPGGMPGGMPDMSGMGGMGGAGGAPPAGGGAGGPTIEEVD